MGDIVEEDKRFCTLAHYVVHAHSHGVYAYGVVLAEHKSVFQLGAHSVRTRNKTVSVRLVVQSVKSAERTQISEHAAVISGFDVLLHQFNRLVSRFHVYAGAFVVDSHVNLRKIGQIPPL